MYCPQCGTPNADVARFCEKCGSPLAAAGAAAAGAQPGSASFPGEGSVGAGPATGPSQSPPPYQIPPPPPTNFPDPRIRGAAGYEVGPQNVPGGRRYAVGKDPTIALLLSLFLSPVGQFYNGDIKKALAIIAGYVVGGILSFVYVGVVLILGIWIWSFIDAYNVAKQKTPLW